VLRKHVASYPKSALGHSSLGMAYLQKDDVGNAKQSYETASRLNPRDPGAQLALATVSSRLGQPAQAKQYREKFEQLRAREFQSRQQSRRGYDDVAAMRKDLATIYANAGRIYHAGQNPREAERIWQRAAAVDPKGVSSRQALARLYRRSGRTAEAAGMLEQLAEIEPADASYLIEIGNLRIELGQPDKAEAALRQACQRAPKSAGPHAALAELYVKGKHKLADAAALARKAAEIEPTAPHFWLLASACRQSGDVPAARAAIEKAIELDPGNLEYRAAYESLKEKK
jgi:cytochrome c-type biogenesis protein CcmH/NrfG